MRQCKNCEKEFRHKDCPSTRARNCGYFCSRSCNAKVTSKKFLPGKDNLTWKGGRILASRGYYYVKCLNHPRANCNGYVMEHRLVMELSIGRYLEPEEQIHHKNGIKTDNRIENLEILTISEHMKLEHSLGTFTKHLTSLNYQRWHAEL